MNKNPFVPPPPYPAHQQPPLPPGPPPPQPAAQPDYSAYWAAQQQANAQPAFNPQWSTPNPPWPAAQPGQIAAPPKPPTDQSAALYANYGYGGHQAAHWQQHQQQQQHHYAQPPTAVAPAVAPQVYNPYPAQSTATYSQPPQPYITAQPQTQAPTQQPFRPMQPPQAPQQTFFQQQQSQQQQQPRLPTQHAPSNQQMPPAKRPRFDNAHQSNPQQGRFQQGSQSMQGVPSGPSKHSGLPSQPSQMQSQGSFSGRGGMGGGRGTGMNRGGRGGPMGGNRGMPMNRGRGGGANHVGVGRGGGLGHSGGGSLRGHQSRDRGGFNNFNRRGGSSFNNGPHRHHHGPPDRSNRPGGGGSMHGGYTRSGRSDGFHRGISNSASAGSVASVSKREENRRTLTDFKIVGLEIRSLGWHWGYVPHETDPVATKDEVSAETEKLAEGSGEPKEHAKDSDKLAVNEHQAAQAASNGATAARMRIYFHTPPSADDARPILPTPSYSDLRKGKRKKTDDDEGETEDGVRPPPPPPLPNGSESIDDRSTEIERGSVAPSVAETASEGDWLMAAITDGDADAEGDTEGYEHTQIEGEFDEHGDDGASVFDHSMSESEVHKSELGAKVDDDSAVGDGQNSDVTRVDSAGDETGTTKADVVKAEDTGTSAAYTSELPGDGGTQAEGKGDGVEASSTVREENFELIVSSIDQSSLGGNGKLVGPNHSAVKVENDASPDKIANGESDHLPEPPASPTSNTAFSGSSASTSTAANPDLPVKPVANNPRVASSNRVSIAYAAGSRRLIIDSDVVERMIIFRAEGRIDIDMIVERVKGGFKGILIETLHENKAYTPIAELSEALDSDSTLPPFWKAEPGAKALLSVHLDKDRPLSEPKWVKTGDVQDWVKDMFGGRFWVAGEAVGWEKKIEVRYPDPAPSIQTVLNSWATNSPVGAPTERSRFVKTHMTEADNILEILLRLVRGERATPFSQTSSALSSPSIQGPLLAALDTSSPHAAQQTHVSLAVMAFVRLATHYAEQAVGEGKGKEQVEERVGEIIRSLPSHLLYKSLDGMFKEWRAEKKGGR